MELNNTNYENDGFITMKRWLENRNEGKTFVDYFKKCRFRKIAIYGAGDMGKLLYAEIKDSDIEVLFFVDRNAEGIREMDGIPVVTIDRISKMPEVDIIVITPAGNFDAISQALAKTVPSARTISLKEAVYEF
jgi:prephenate dehydrogenase